MCVGGKQLKNIDLMVFPQFPIALEAQSCIKENAQIDI